MRRLLCLLLSLIVCLGALAWLPGAAMAEETEDTAQQQNQAEELSSVHLITGSSNIPSLFRLFDGDLYLWEPSHGAAHLSLSSPKGFGSLYLMFTYLPGTYTLTNDNTGQSVTCGQDGFLHEFVDLMTLFGQAPTEITLSFDQSVSIREMRAFTQGQVPDDIQKWKKPLEGEADLVLFSTHADDEHLFFLGILPYYARELGYNVQVVYFTDHNNYQPEYRNMESLNGLWAVGMDIYPVAGDFEDFLVEYHKEVAYQRYESQYGRTREEMLEFVVEQIRRFKPVVAIGHDFAGEYGHAMHMIYAEILAEAVQLSMDPEVFPESAEKYGVWDVSKTYFHMYEENEIVLDWDQPLASFGGDTAFQVSIRRGFAQHVKQIQDFAWYYTGYSRAADLPFFNPCYYGLYRTTVGPDVQKDDFFENATTHDELAQQAEAERLAEEERKAQQEAERLKAEEEERLRQEQEAQKQAQEEADRLAEIEAQKQAQEKTRQKKAMIIATAAISFGLLVITVVISVVVILKKEK